MKKKLYNKIYSKILEYFSQEGVELINGREYAYCAEDKIVTAPQRYFGTDSYLISLLHELGHIKQENPFFDITQNVDVKKMLIIHLEYDAWIKGLNFLNLYLKGDDKFKVNYIKMFKSCFSKYVNNIDLYQRSTLNFLHENYLVGI